MIFLGIILIGLAAGTTVGIISDNANNAANVTLSTLVGSFHGLSVSGTFLLGSMVACMFLVGCALISGGMRRFARVRRELRDLRVQQDVSVQALMAEKAQLERELARERYRPEATIGPGRSIGPGAVRGPGGDLVSGLPGAPTRFSPDDLARNDPGAGFGADADA